MMRKFQGVFFQSRIAFPLVAVLLTSCHSNLQLSSSPILALQSSPQTSPQNSTTVSSSPATAVKLSTSANGIVLCDELSSYSGTGHDAADVILACIHQTPAGGVLELPAGLYTLLHQITFDRSITMRTQGKAGAPMCDYELGLDCAVLIADPNFNVQLGLMHNTQPNVTLDHIVLDGNREARLTTSTGSAIAQNCSKDNSMGFNALTSANGFSFIGSVSKHAICGTGMGVTGDGITIQSSAFVENGDHRAVWSDGLTVNEASNSKFIGNLFVSNSDVDMIFGGCKNCLIQNNVIRHGTHYRYSSFAAFMTHAWPNGATSGNYSGSDISGNQVDCGVARRCGFGMMLGADPWYQATYYGGGDYHDNSITNAQEGLIIDHSTASMHVHNISVQNSAGGTNAGSCGFRGTEAYDVSSNSIVDFSGDNVAASNYQHMDWKGCIANMSEYLNPALASPVVTQMFPDILGRPVDGSGLSSFSSWISSSGSVSQAWVSMAKSAEAASLISSTFQTILGRSPSSSDVSNLQTWLGDGHTVRHLRAYLILSAEGQARLLQALTQSLGRAPSPSELQQSGSSVMNGASLPTPAVTVRKSAAISTTYSVLKMFVKTCDGSTPVSLDCNTAVNRFCEVNGYDAGGFGPVEHAGDIAIVTCVHAGQVDQIKATFADLQGYQSLCNSSDPLNTYCASSVNRYCSAQGYDAGGFGPFEISGDSMVVSCVKPTQATVITDTFAGLQSIQPACNGSTATQDYCKSAIHRSCIAKGYVSGYGVLEMNPSVVIYACIK